MCLSTGGWVSASVHAGMLAPPRPGRSPWTTQTPQPGRPPDQADPPGPGRPPQDQADPLGPGRSPQDQADPWDQTDPPGPGKFPLDQADTPLGPGRHPPTGTRQIDPPPPASRLQHTVYEWPVPILLECILVIVTFSVVVQTIPGRYTPQSDGTPHRGTPLGRSPPCHSAY